MASRVRLLSRLSNLLAPCILALALAACGDSKDDDNENVNENDNRVDVVTSATPDAPGMKLESSGHQGWQQADCKACHGDPHDSAYRLPDCASCHGPNGAPTRASGHPDQGCAGCHAASHAGLGLAAPSDCRACHSYAVSPGECGIVSSHDVVVVGGGGGGLSAAAILAQAGMDVVLLEKNYKVGGCMTTFERGPYRIEVSLHGFDGLDQGAGMNVELLEELGISERLVPLRLDPLYTSTFPDFAMTVPADASDYHDLLKEQFPLEADGLDALFLELGHLDVLMQAAIEFQETGSLPPGVTTDDLLYLQSIMEMTLSEFLDPYIEDPELFALFTVLSGFTGTRPSELSALFFIAIWNSYHTGGYYYFEGGSQAISDALAGVIVDSGGQVQTHVPVTRIVVEGAQATQVQTADGRCFDTRYVISNAPAPHTAHDLVGDAHFPSAYLQEMSQMTIGAAVFVLYMGVGRDYSPEFGESHELMKGEGYDTDEAYNASASCLPEAVSMAYTNYTMIDPTSAPAGSNVITITTLMPLSCFDEWRWDESHEAYRLQKEAVADVLIDRAEDVLPDLRQNLEYLEIATPQTIRGFTRSDGGTIFGWDNVPEQSLMMRLGQSTPISNLLLAGSWTYPGGGQSAVLISGKMAAGTILDAENNP